MMKGSAPALATTQTADKSGLGMYLELAKARLTALVLFTTLAGFCVGSKGWPEFGLMTSILIGTALVASGAAALNQLIEKDYDSRMLRTESRPLPSGRIQPETVLVFGIGIASVGLVWLAIGVNLLTSLLGALTLLSYLFVYTPLKRVTTLNTTVGAISGALPPLMGWTAARGEIGKGGLALFAILFLWQLPHFMSIAWMYKEEYAKAGFVMLPSVDPTGGRTGRFALGNTVGLLIVSLTPYLFGLSGRFYLVSAMVLGLAFLVFAFRFCQDLSRSRARQLFFMSIIYLPFLLAIMVIDKTS
ncbi:MAG: heme o synthase [Verrucomicrobia bacterium]|nr:heme o synthase [Verrucomicrobiota bacterium]